MVATAASPEEKARQRPPSSSPSACSNAAQVGLPYLPYSTSPPATYVDAIVSGSFNGLSGSCGGRPYVPPTRVWRGGGPPGRPREGGGPVGRYGGWVDAVGRHAPSLGTASRVGPPGTGRV